MEAWSYCTLQPQALLYVIEMYVLIFNTHHLCNTELEQKKTNFDIFAKN